MTMKSISPQRSAVPPHRPALVPVHRHEGADAMNLCTRLTDRLCYRLETTPDLLCAPTAPHCR